MKPLKDGHLPAKDVLAGAIARAAEKLELTRSAMASASPSPDEFQMMQAPHGFGRQMGWDRIPADYEMGRSYSEDYPEPEYRPRMAGTFDRDTAAALQAAAKQINVDAWDMISELVRAGLERMAEDPGFRALTGLRLADRQLPPPRLRAAGGAEGYVPYRAGDRLVVQAGPGRVYVSKDAGGSFELLSPPKETPE